MNPSAPLDQNQVQTPTEQVQAIKTEMVKVKPNPSVLFYILSFVLGIALTIGTLILFDIDLAKSLGLKEDTVNNTINNNANNEDKAPVIVDDKEEVKEEIKEIGVVYENKDILVEYWKDSPENARTFIGLLPAKTAIALEGATASRYTKLIYTDDKTGTTEITLGFPHFVLDEPILSYEKVTGTNFYRVKMQSSPNTIDYAENITLTGQCDAADTKINAPCGVRGIKVSGITLLITLSNTKNDFTVSDRIITSLKLK